MEKAKVLGKEAMENKLNWNPFLVPIPINSMTRSPMGLCAYQLPIRTRIVPCQWLFSVIHAGLNSEIHLPNKFHPQSQFAFAVNGDEVQMPPSMAIRWSHTPDFWMLLSILVNGLLPNWTDRVATPDFTTVYWVFDALLPFPTLASVGISITSYLAAIDKRYITRSDRHVP